MTEDAGTVRIPTGTEVLDRDGQLVGRVTGRVGDVLEVRRGRFLVADSYVPLRAVASWDGTVMRLSVVADEAAMAAWHDRPRSTLPEGETGPEWDAVDGEEELAHLTDTEGNLRIPVLEDRLRATPRRVRRGVVRVETRLDADTGGRVTAPDADGVRVGRRVVHTTAEGHEIVLEGGTLEIPFFGHDVDTEREVRVVEEVVIATQAVERVQRVSGTVRREDVRVVEEGETHAERAGQS